MPFHEIGCHTEDHYYFRGNNNSEFIKSIHKNKIYLEKEIGKVCNGFRSPGGLVPKDLVKHLEKMDFLYDSSVLPGIIPGRYYNFNSPRIPYFPSRENILIEDIDQDKIIEIPMAVSSFFRLSLNGFFMPFFFNSNKVFSAQNPVITYTHLSDYIKNTGRIYFWDRLKRYKKSLNIFNQFIANYKNTDMTISKLCRRILS